MAIKDDIQSVKKEIDSQEQFLENIIKSERFIKRYKKPLICTFVAVCVVAAGYYGLQRYESHKFHTANSAYAQLLKNPNDAEAILVLKDKNPALYTVYEYQMAVDKNDIASLKKIASTPGIDPLFKKVVEFEAGEVSGDFMGEYNSLLRGYELMKEGKIEAANLEFAKIQADSRLQEIVRNLKHYHGNK